MHCGVQLFHFIFRDRDGKATLWISLQHTFEQLDLNWLAEHHVESDLRVAGAAVAECRRDVGLAVAHSGSRELAVAGVEPLHSGVLLFQILLRGLREFKCIYLVAPPDSQVDLRIVLDESLPSRTFPSSL